MTHIHPILDDMQRAMAKALGTHWKLFMVQGVVLVVLGVFAVAAPVVATFAVDVTVGWLFLFSGIAGLVAMFSAKDTPAFLWSLITAALSIVVGVLLLRAPLVGVLSLTFVLTAFFIAEGVFQIAASMAYRDVITGSWGWMLASGVADLALAGIVVASWPLSAGWVLGLLVGINLLTSGGAIVMAALAGRDMARALDDPTGTATP